LTHERTFTRPQLRKYIYPGVCWWFVAWMAMYAIVLALMPMRQKSLLLIWDFGLSFRPPPTGPFSLTLIMGTSIPLGMAVGGAAVTAAVSRFRPRGYTLFLPVLLVLFGLMLTQKYVLLEAGLWSERFSLRWQSFTWPTFPSPTLMWWVQVFTNPDQG